MRDSIFISNLRIIIGEKKIKQIKLAELSGVSNVNLQRMLSGEVKDSKLSNVEKIADALEEHLGISRQWLINGEGNQTDTFTPRAISREHAKAARILADHMIAAQYGAEALHNLEFSDAYNEVYCKQYDQLIERSAKNTTRTKDSKAG